MLSFEQRPPLTEDEANRIAEINVLLKLYDLGVAVYLTDEILANHVPRSAFRFMIRNEQEPIPRQYHTSTAYFTTVEGLYAKAHKLMQEKNVGA